MKIFAFLIALSWSLVPAAACSVHPGYRVPTNLELAERADTILVGTVTGARTGAGSSFSDSAIQIAPTQLLKGAALPPSIEIQGWLANARMRAHHSDPRELRRVNPDALTGGCTRYIFEKGMKLVLFFERDKQGKLAFAAYPFARVSEDVPSDRALWVEAVRIYARIAALPAGERPAAIVAERDRLRADRGANAALLAADLDRELALHPDFATR